MCLDVDDWHISYNPSINEGICDIAMTKEDETAICREGRYYILYGDHRKEYEKIINDNKDNAFDKCVEYFKAHQNEMGFWSNEVEEYVLIQKFYTDGGGIGNEITTYYSEKDALKNAYGEYILAKIINKGE